MGRTSEDFLVVKVCTIQTKSLCSFGPLVYRQTSGVFTRLVPCPSETWFRGWVWEGLSGGCRAGLTLERCSQLAAFVIRTVGGDAAAVWLAEGGVPRCVRLFRAPIWCPLLWSYSTPSRSLTAVVSLEGETRQELDGYKVSSSTFRPLKYLPTYFQNGSQEESTHVFQFGALREGGGTREAGSTVAESLVVIDRVGTHQTR